MLKYVKQQSSKRFNMADWKKDISQSVGFEPTLPEGIWFLVRRLNHSATTAEIRDVEKEAFFHRSAATKRIQLTAISGSDPEIVQQTC